MSFLNHTSKTVSVCILSALYARFEAGFDDALANASVAAAMIRSWESERWEDVVSLRIEDGDVA